MESTSNDAVMFVVNETSLPGLVKKCLCCLEFLKDKTHVVKIMDCGHEMCQECFNRWKRMKDTCPMCRCKITKIREATKDLGKAIDDESKYISMNLNLDYFHSVEKEFEFVKEETTEAEIDLACLDHAYFQEELEKLNKLAIDVKRERFEVRNAKGTNHEWAVLKQVEIQLDNLFVENEDLIQFDIKQRLEDVYSMAETLFKIKTGKLEKEQLINDEDQYYDEYDNYGEYDDCYQDDQYYDDISADFYEDELIYTKKIKPFSTKRR